MNYYNPYFYSIPNTLPTPKVGLFSRIFGGGINLGSILNGTQRALNFANQAIPLVKQVRPMIGNAKTMFRVMNEFKRVEIPKNNNDVNINNKTNTEKITVEKNNDTIENIYSNESGPTFFI